MDFSGMISRPLFDSGMAAWHGVADTEALAELIRSIQPVARMLEVGSWVGLGSTQVFIHEIKRFDELTCVDNWLGNSEVPYLEDAARDYDIYETFRRNTAAAPDIKVLIMDSVDAATWFESDSLDLVFIDGDHRYSAVMADIAAWRPKVRAGGILCGHDCERRVTDCEDRVRLTAVSERDSGEGVHAGVVLAVDVAFRGGASLFAERGQHVQPSSIWYLVC